MLSRLSICVSFASLALAGILSGAACSSSTGTAGTTGGGGQSTGTGGPVEGPADTHCGTKKQAVSAASCHPAMTTSSSTGAGGAGTGGAGGAAISEYGATLDNAEGDDDDCKYHLAWTATPIRQSTDVTFTAVVTTTTDSKPLAAGEVDLEVFLNDTHPAPNSDAKVTESPTGTYKIGPIRFDAAGKWTVRFHVHEDCSDLSADSPHGHVAFFVNVP
ncbi:MAG: hypothetical protein ABJE95_15100 [Byssovorax sp.]